MLYLECGGKGKVVQQVFEYFAIIEENVLP
jgi:hypothetical protein